jgi:exosortase K
MKLRFSRRRAAQLLVVLLGAFALKQYYSTASVNQLRWILAPTTFIVELITGSQFEFESHAGYMSADHTFLIAASCAGVNFLITAFLMLSLRKLWREQKSSWTFIPAFAFIAYLATLMANTVRISTAIRLQQTTIDIGGLDGNQLHRLEGILIYFGFLMLLYLVSERMSEGSRTRAIAPSDGFGLLRQALFPLLIYYATTLGIPLATTFCRGGSTNNALWEHLAFVSSAPLILLAPLATFHFAFTFARRWKHRLS